MAVITITAKTLVQK